MACTDERASRACASWSCWSSSRGGRFARWPRCCLRRRRWNGTRLEPRASRINGRPALAAFPPCELARGGRLDSHSIQPAAVMGATRVPRSYRSQRSITNHCHTGSTPFSMEMMFSCTTAINGPVAGMWQAASWRTVLSLRGVVRKKRGRIRRPSLWRRYSEWEHT